MKLNLGINRNYEKKLLIKEYIFDYKRRVIFNNKG